MAPDPNDDKRVYSVSPQEAFMKAAFAGTEKVNREIARLQALERSRLEAMDSCVLIFNTSPTGQVAGCRPIEKEKP